MPGADASKLRRGAGERKSPQSAPDSLAAFERTKRSWAAELNRSSVATPSVLPAAPERAAGIAQVEDGPAGLRRPAGPSTSEGRGEAEIKMRNGCVASGRVKSEGWTSYSVVVRAPRLNPPSVSTVRLLRGKFKGGGKLEA